MRSDVKSHESLKEGLAGFVVREERVPVDVVELTGGWHGTPRGNPRHITDVQAQEFVEPVFHCITIRVTNRLIQRDLMQNATGGRRLSLRFGRCCFGVARRNALLS